MRNWMRRLRSFSIVVSALLLTVGGPLFLTLPRHGGVLAAIDAPGKWQVGAARLLEALPAFVALLLVVSAKLLRMHRKGTSTIESHEEQILALQDTNHALKKRVTELEKHPPLRATQVVRLVKEGVEAAQKGGEVSVEMPAEIGEHLAHVVKGAPNVLREGLEKLGGLSAFFDRLNVALSALQAYQARTGAPSEIAEEKSVVVQGVVGPPVSEDGVATTKESSGT